MRPLPAHRVKQPPSLRSLTEAAAAAAGAGAGAAVSPGSTAAGDYYDDEGAEGAAGEDLDLTGGGRT
jgi:hypothetical protein